jgi:hypothetical protein
MPFKSEKQRKYLWANEPEIARDWTDTYGSKIHKAEGGIMQDGYVNFTKGSDSVTVPKKFKARKDATPTHLAYITKAEAAQLKKQNKGTPHKGPEGIPSYDDYDATGGGYGRATSGSQMSAAETGGSGHGMSSGEAAQHRAAAQAAANMSARKAAEKQSLLAEAKRINKVVQDYGIKQMAKKDQARMIAKINHAAKIGNIAYDDDQTYDDIFSSYKDKDLFNDGTRGYKEKTIEDFDTGKRTHGKAGIGPEFFAPGSGGISLAANLFGNALSGPITSEQMNHLMTQGGKLSNLPDDMTRDQYMQEFRPKTYARENTEPTGGEGGGGNPYIYPTTSVASAAESAGQSDLDKYLAGLGGDYQVPIKYVQNQTRAADGGRVPAAYGGIMDTYTGRRKYGFGSIFKKAKKAVKKLTGSKLGKLAAMAGIGYLATPGTGAGWQKWLKPGGKGNWWKDVILGKETGIVPNPGERVGGVLNILKNPWVSIPAASAATGLLTAQQPEEQLDDVQGRWDADKAAFDAYLASLDDEDSYVVPEEYRLAEGGRIGKQEGGIMDLGGMEKDYRNDGGFVPIGGEEKADDVPARLSRNEFVFTADAVRSAGGGDIDKGAQVMENVMKNLEQGGTVSEESQGKGGAQDMFEVSERLSEVM